MTMNGVSSSTITGSNVLDDGETKTICIIDYDSYTITVTLRDVASGDGTGAAQYVKVHGTAGTTLEYHCPGEFARGATVTCTVTSDVDIGEYRCVIWRTSGTDGWDLVQVKGSTKYPPRSIMTISF